MEKKPVSPADILWVCDTIYTKGYHVKPHAHIDYYHLIYMREGNCTVTINNQVEELNSGSFMIAMPEDVHEICEIKSETPVKFWEIKFTLHSQLLKKALKESGHFFTADEVENGLLSDIIHNGFENKLHMNTTAGRYFLLAFLYHVYAEEMTRFDTECSVYCLRGIDTSSFSRATIETAQYIEKNYMNEVTLEQIGESIGYYKNYISTVVKKDLSITVNELLTFVRIQKAAELLYYSDCDIKQIYTLTGFKNISHFSRIFKKMVGVPPSQYRASFPSGVLENNLKTEPAEPTGRPVRDTSVPVWVHGLLRDYIESHAN